MIIIIINKCKIWTRTCIEDFPVACVPVAIPSTPWSTSSTNARSTSPTPQRRWKEWRSTSTRYSFSSLRHRCVLGELYNCQEVRMWLRKNNKTNPSSSRHASRCCPFASLFLHLSVCIRNSLESKNEEYWRNMTRDLFYSVHEYWFVDDSGAGSCHCQCPQDCWVWNYELTRCWWWEKPRALLHTSRNTANPVTARLSTCLSEGTCWDPGYSSLGPTKLAKFASV